MNTLEIEELRLTLPGTARPVLNGVTLAVGAGETVALVGESGSGKTLTSRAALGFLPRDAEVTGVVRVAGKDLLTMTPEELRGVRALTVSMIFQEPRTSLNPLRRIGDFLTEGLRTNLHWTAQRAGDRARELLDAVGLDDRVLRQYPHELSGGMLQRVTIAAALMSDPALLLADEPTTALDVTTQAEIVALLADLRTRFQTALLFVTHDLHLAAAISDRVCVMYAGRIVESGPADALFDKPRHPYTAALLGSTPRLDHPRKRLDAISGQPPDLRTALSGCPFAARCPHATDLCRAETPASTPVDGGTVACHHHELLSLEGI
ncbi:ABC transporter ATP-binding protein [Longispora fulva]|uniref:Oligopeptide/dipeptide ABC transporter ATP-binding protein n=1 Tax=Longispora fulva TaxID=619741 RepID=A0A8J7KKR4_9ACTN|nr:ABC transporter ATP-binding protein [Longispora fulva]MBG6137046.1 oligopeptide/dipeptide ABC transporter ATP-binding protein [Longispora fulva]GIG61600.1 ABC transporter ATP-binding protein [Longispora fulva]